MHSTEKLAAFASGLRHGNLPAAVAAQAQRCLTDALGCLLGAQRTGVGGIVRSFVRASGAPGPVRVLGSDLRTSAGVAAFAHATLINALDFDDIYDTGHPGATVIGAAISLAQELGSGEHDLIAALVAGYEVSCRAGVSLVRTGLRQSLHGHGTWQALGAAAASARLLGLNATQTAHALAIAAANAPVASVMKTVYGARPSLAKNNFGAAAQGGVNAARLAQAGFDGPLDMLDGDTGFWRMAGADGVDTARLTGGLGRDFELLRVGFKTWSTCRLVQSSVQASLAVLAQAGVAPDSADIARWVVQGAPILTRAPFSSPHPADMAAAPFSAPYGIAMAALGVAPGPDWFAAHALQDKRALAIAARIELQPLPPGELQGYHHPARAQLVLHDGRRFVHDVPVAQGDAANPLPHAFIEAKFHRLAAQPEGSAPATGFGKFAQLCAH